MTIGFIEGPVTGTTDIDWLSSTTTTKVRRERDSSHTDVEHIARFAITPGAVADSPAEFSRTAIFQPVFMVARWEDGQLLGVTLSGPLRLKGGGVSEKISRKREWRNWREPLDRTQLPEPVAAALLAYEQAVAGVAANGGDHE
ncbi:hypothetical protein SEALOLALOVE_57 [Mycobacterium phage Lolalove]|uniref:Uncharacterized protein n=1 Tax=Mycobacterium phage Lolalove TaxID=2772027 RepID=A0A7L7SQE8_9CAUD|nr:hypothetical protein SEALOLALOVE_57 [Mycobacterium phage Lolalove]